MGKAAKVPTAIALDSEKQKTFTNSIKKLQKQVTQTSPTDTSERDAYLQRGLVYINHIPHGFYEKAIKGYFKQFGFVTNVRVLRSHRSGRSKGAAFVEFLEPGVAKIAAETMDNYLMFKRRLEAKYIEPEDRHRTLFNIKISTTNFPKKKRRIENKNMKNAKLPDKEYNKRTVKKMKNLRKSGALAFCQIVNVKPGINKGLKFNQLAEKVKEAKSQVKTEKKQIKTEVEESTPITRKAKKVKVEVGVEETSAPITRKAKKIKTEFDVEETSAPVTRKAKKVKTVVKLEKVAKSKSNVDDSKKSKLKSVVKNTVDKKTVNKVTKSLKTIKKSKDKKTGSNIVLKPELISKITTRSKTLGEGKGKAKLTLDPALVQEVRFAAPKAKKGASLYKAKKVRKS